MNYEKCQFTVEYRIVLGHVVFARGFEVDKVKINIILSLLYLVSIWEVHSFPEHAGFYQRFINEFKNSITLMQIIGKGYKFHVCV